MKEKISCSLDGNSIKRVNRFIEQFGCIQNRSMCIDIALRIMEDVLDSDFTEQSDRTEYLDLVIREV